MRKAFEFEDDKYGHLKWRVVMRQHTVTFHANVDEDDEPFDPNAGEFCLTLTRADIENMLRHVDPEENP